jgi:hypothetical protein
MITIINIEIAEFDQRYELLVCLLMLNINHQKPSII